MLFLLAAAQAYGLSVPTDGCAAAEILFADARLIVVAHRVGGTPGATLLGLNPRDGQVLWRQHASNGCHDMLSDNPAELYAIEGSSLVARSRNDGAVVWSHDLAELDWHRWNLTAKEIDPDRRQVDIPAFISKEGENYFNLFSLTADAFFVSRESYSMSGCVVRLYGDASVWLALFRKDRRIIMQAGKGEFLGAGSFGVIALADYSRQRLLLVTGSQIRDITEKAGVNLSSVLRGGVDARAAAHQLSRTCLFTPRRGRDQMLYDAETDRVYEIRPEPVGIGENDYQTNWGQSDVFLVCYTECSRKRQETKPLSVAVHSLTGKFVGRVWFPLASVEPQVPYTEYVGLAGVSNSGLFVFMRDTSIYAGDPDKATGPQSERHTVFLVNAAGPEIVRSFPLPEADDGFAGGTVVRNTDALVQVSGNYFVPYGALKADEAREHTLACRLLSLEDGRELWRHRERVLIRKPEAEPSVPFSLDD